MRGNNYDNMESSGSSHAFAKTLATENVHALGPPPAYTLETDGGYETSRQWWNPKTWGKKIFIGVGVGIVALIVIVVAVAVTEVKKNRYPDYSKLTYTLNTTFSGTSFFDNFDYFTGYDPTSGFVHYMLADQAKPYNLTYASSTSAVIRVDNTQDNQTTGRYSVRLTSKKAWDNGLFVFDIKHTPYGCGTWPALWTTNANLATWPASGEIDIMEATNNATTGNSVALHTTDSCSMDVKRKETGTSSYTNCYNGTNDNSGCGVQGVASTYGPVFNAAGGGVMAMELRSAGIRVWQFSRSSIPSDLTARSPDPSTWTTPFADFPSTDCSIDSHFKNQSIIANIDVCGTWAGSTSVYKTQWGCPSDCTTFAANNPSAFDNAYWEFGNFTIYSAA